MGKTGERRYGAWLIALLCTGGVLLPGAASAAEPPGHSGRWITGSDGRVLIMHGLNMVSKIPPYLPSNDGFGKDDARFLARNGFNTIRLGVIYKGLEPSPGTYDRGYLRDLMRTERVLAREGIYTMVDFHQDLYNERYSGEGWPDWATLDDGLPAVPDLGFPANYFAMPALSRAFDHFWANDPGPGGVGLQDRYAAAFGVVAKAFKKRPRVMGYDLMNEPWPGTIWPTCANPIGCPAFDRGPLTAFHRRVTQAIRKRDSRHLVWYEPAVIFNFGADSSHESPDPRAGFSFHNYCLADAVAGLLPPGNPIGAAACPVIEDLVMNNADKQARQTGDALMLSEFGATDDLGVIRRIVDSAEEHMVSWQEWHYCDCADPTTSGPGVQSLVLDPRKPPRGTNVKREKLEILARPYPQAVAGTPQRFGFDEADSRFEFAYRTRRPDGRAPRAGLTTDVFVPKIHYPRGYRVRADGARVVSKPRSRLLRLRACRGADLVSVEVQPGAGRSGRGCRP
jgi:endoglycosylceramidase